MSESITTVNYYESLTKTTHKLRIIATNTKNEVKLTILLYIYVLTQKSLVLSEYLQALGE